MNARTLVAGVLLGFAAATLVVLVVKEVRGPSGVAQGEASPRAEVAAPGDRQVAVYYFYGHKRCGVCRKVEELSRRAVTESFPDDLRDGRLVWHAVNYEAPQNDPLAREYGLASKSLVIVELQRGERGAWKRLDRVWQMVWDDRALMEYVRAEVATALRGGPWTMGG
jgi:hypothetical protein